MCPDYRDFFCLFVHTAVAEALHLEELALLEAPQGLLAQCMELPVGHEELDLYIGPGYPLELGHVLEDVIACVVGGPVLEADIEEVFEAHGLALESLPVLSGDVDSLPVKGHGPLASSGVVGVQVSHDLGSARTSLQGELYRVENNHKAVGLWVDYGAVEALKVVPAQPDIALGQAHLDGIEPEGLGLEAPPYKGLDSVEAGVVPARYPAFCNPVLDVTGVELLSWEVYHAEVDGDGL